MMIGYARVSTHDQNAEMQVDALRAAGCEKVFVETVSGVAVDRPQLKLALRATRKGDALVVWKLDRLARSFAHLLETVADLDRRHVGFISLTENIDTVTAGGRLVMHIFGALAEFERAIIHERTMAGLEAARARGRVGGRPRKLSEADIAVARTLLQETDTPVPDIAKRLKVSVSTLYARVGALRLPPPDHSR